MCDLLSALGGSLRQSIHDLEENAEQEISRYSLEPGERHEASKTGKSVDALTLGLRGQRSVAQRTSAMTRR